MIWKKLNRHFNIINFLEFWKKLPKYFKNKKSPKGQQRFFYCVIQNEVYPSNLSNNLNKTQFGQGLLHENMSQKFGTLWKYFISQSGKPLGSICDLFSHMIESQNNLRTHCSSHVLVLVKAQVGPNNI